MIFAQNNNQTGFSLVETLVAITILLIVIVGPLTLVTNSARSTNFANDQVMAFFLAQEGLELVQSARDDLLIPTFDPTYSGLSAWSRFTDTTGTYQFCFSGGCGVDVNQNSAGSLNLYDCRTSTTNCRIYYNSDPHDRTQYTHETTTAGSSNTASRYTRVISMNETTAGQVEIISTVTWRSDGQRAEQTVEAVTYLFDVYGR